MDKLPFNQEQQQQIIQTIKQAEKNTSGEIRVHLEPSCNLDPIDRAVNVFNTIGMVNTQKRNGVLIYIAYNDKKFAIIGDKGINELVPDNFWNETKDLMKAYFVKGQLTEGIIKGILSVGEQLKKFFPYQENDQNELTDQISFGN
jgi:uncharacterized membrane protein